MQHKDDGPLKNRLCELVVVSQKRRFKHCLNFLLPQDGDEVKHRATNWV
jgi:hypothetical protein